MARFNRARFNAAQSRLRDAVRKMKSAQRKLEHDLRHPVVRISCPCGYQSRHRRSLNALPDECPACGAPILWGP